MGKGNTKTVHDIKVQVVKTDINNSEVTAEKKPEMNINIRAAIVHVIGDML